MSYDELDDLKYEVVWLANEDVTGVYEVLWIANGWWPDKLASERLRLAEDALRWALERGLITLHEDDDADSRPLSPDESAERLRDWRTWANPDRPAPFFWRTDAGEAFFEEKPVPRSWTRRTWIGANRGAGDVEYPDLS